MQIKITMTGLCTLLPFLLFFYLSKCSSFGMNLLDFPVVLIFFKSVFLKKLLSCFFRLCTIFSMKLGSLE